MADDSEKRIKLYTGIGDKGTTRLFGGGPVSKASARVDAYGRVDELSAAIGFARVAVTDRALMGELLHIQNDLFDVGADLATPDDSPFRSRLPRLIDGKDSERLERLIDHYDEQTPPIRAFILPGGTEAAARMHLARVACRSAERAVVALSEVETVRNEVVVYLNRLADLLFQLARWLNHASGVPDITWQQGP